MLICSVRAKSRTLHVAAKAILYEMSCYCLVDEIKSQGIIQASYAKQDYEGLIGFHYAVFLVGLLFTCLCVRCWVCSLLLAKKGFVWHNNSNNKK